MCAEKAAFGRSIVSPSSRYAHTSCVWADRSCFGLTLFDAFVVCQLRALGSVISVILVFFALLMARRTKNPRPSLRTQFSPVRVLSRANTGLDTYALVVSSFVSQPSDSCARNHAACHHYSVARARSPCALLLFGRLPRRPLGRIGCLPAVGLRLCLSWLCVPVLCAVAGRPKLRTKAFPILRSHLAQEVGSRARRSHACMILPLEQQNERYKRVDEDWICRILVLKYPVEHGNVGFDGNDILQRQVQNARHDGRHGPTRQLRW